MAGDNKRIINFNTATTVGSDDYAAIDSSTNGTRKILLKTYLDNLISAAEGDIDAKLALAYSSSSTYAVGDVCIYSGNFYECTTAIESPIAWNASYWMQTTIGEVLAEIRASGGGGGGGGGTSPSPYTSNPAALGTASPGSSTYYSRGDHVHPKPSASDIGALPSNTTYVSSVNGSSGAVTISTATTNADGLMSSTDKSHLEAVYADYSSAITALGVS